MNLDLQRQDLELKKARIEDALRRDLEDLHEAYKNTVQVSRCNAMLAEE